MARVVVEGHGSIGPDARVPDTKFCKLLRISALIGTYFALSIGLTFYQRWFIQKFHYPLLVALCHTTLKLGVSLLIRQILHCCTGRYKTTLAWRDVLRSTLPVGFTSGIDIAFSNWGLEYITVSLYTMTKSTSLIFILIFAVLFKLEKKSWTLCGIVVMIAGGLAMFTYKSTQFVTVGFCLVLLASFSSGIRWTLCQFVMQKSNLGLEHPIDMMYHLQPWMFIVIIPFLSAFEGKQVFEAAPRVWNDWGIFLHYTFLISVGGSLAILLELIEYRVVSSLSSLTLSVAAVFKEVVALVLAVEWNGDQMTVINSIGLLLCLGGIVLHVASKFNSQRNAQKKGALTRDDATARFLHHDISSSDEQEDDKDSSTEVLFSVLHSRDR